jgi:CRP-like cAMP-binding protein
MPYLEPELPLEVPKLGTTFLRRSEVAVIESITTLNLEILEAHPFFAGLRPADLEGLASVAEIREVGAGEYLWRQGDPATALYMVLSGRISLEILVPQQGPLQIEIARKGESIACSWGFAPYRWQFDARALEPSTTVVLRVDRLREMCERDPALGYCMIKRVASSLETRLSGSRRRVLELQNH